MKKVYLVSNSQGLSIGIQRNQSYPSILQRTMPDTEFHFWIVSGGNIKDLNIQIENLFLARPDLVVFQMGIVECTQRILSNREKEIFRILPLGRFITKKLHKHRKRVIKVRKILGRSARLISPQQFRSELQTLTKKLQAEAIGYVFLEIPRFSASFETQYFPYINNDINLYNNILKEFGAISFFTESENLDSIWQSGSVHFTPDGHQYAAQNLKKLIQRQFEQINLSTTKNL